MGPLGTLFSAIDTTKRKLGDLFSSPVQSAQQMVGYANDRARGLNELTSGAAQEMKQGLLSGGSTYRPKSQQLTQTIADAYNPMGMVVWHGSPHTFDKFDASKIGTGEGAQAYGHGVYLADAEDMAKGYQKTLAYKAYDLGQEAEKRGLTLSAGARGEFHRKAAANRDPMRAAVGLQNANISARELPQEKLAELFDAFQKDGSDSLYKADLPDEWIPKMLDWDKPLSEQSEILSRFPDEVLDNLGVT